MSRRAIFLAALRQNGEEQAEEIKSLSRMNKAELIAELGKHRATTAEDGEKTNEELRAEIEILRAKMLRAFLQALGIITIKQNAVAIKPTALPVAPPQGRNDAFYETMPVAPKASKVEPYFSGIMSIRQIYDMCKKEGCRDAVMTTTMAMIESGGNPRAVRFEDHLDDYSYGLLQTLYVNSAKWLQKEKGFKRYTLKSPQDLFYPNISIYFGDAVVRWLKKAIKKLPVRNGQCAHIMAVRAGNQVHTVEPIHLTTGKNIRQ